MHMCGFIIIKDKVQGDCHAQTLFPSVTSKNTCTMLPEYNPLTAMLLLSAGATGTGPGLFL